MRHFPRAALLLLLLLGLPAGCGSQSVPASSSAAGRMTADDTAATYTCTAPDGAAVLEVSVNRPQPDGALSGPAADAIEDYYDTVYDAAFEQWQNELAALALDDYDQAGQAGRAFRPYSVEEDCTVTRSDESYFSVLRQRRSYTGGAQEEETVYGEVFDASSGALLSLEDLFLPDSGYADVLRERLSETLADRMQQSPGLFFDDAPAQLDAAFADGCFCLSGDALTFIYPTYTLAPSSAGVIYLDIPLSALTDYMRKA